MHIRLFSIEYILHGLYPTLKAQIHTMESSPLAAMHQGSAWGTASSIFGHGHYTTTSSAHSSVGLREQLHKNAADYFNVKNIRGCSPAASLAADISQNFRLDNEARFVLSFPSWFRSDANSF